MLKEIINILTSAVLRKNTEMVILVYQYLLRLVLISLGILSQQPSKTGVQASNTNAEALFQGKDVGTGKNERKPNRARRILVVKYLM